MSGSSPASSPVNATRMQRMRTLLDDALQPLALDLRDDSHRHVGHEGAKDGRGHFSLRIVSGAFAGLLPLARHRRVYAVLGDMMQTDIHALSIQALAPDENEKPHE